MSYYLAAAAECDAVSSPPLEGSANASFNLSQTNGVSSATSLTAAKDIIRARLEESLQESLASMAVKERQAFNALQREAARAQKAQERAAAQADRHNALMESIRLEREAKEMRAAQDGTSSSEMAGDHVPLPRSLSPSSSIVDRTIPVDLVPIDVFRRIRVEEERLMRMKLPQEGITGMYNTMRRPLDSRDEAEALPANAIVPTVKTLVNELGMGRAAVEAREAHYKAHREALAEVTRILGTVEEEESHIQGREKLARDLSRLDALRRDPPDPPRIAPYPLPTVDATRSQIGEGLLEDSNREERSDHPIDVYHRMVRETLVGRKEI